MPPLPASLIEPLWVELAALIGSDERPEFAPSHPWGCHRRRIPDRVVFDHLIGAFVHGSGYERLATRGCSDRTIRRRLHEWADAGHGPALLRICLTAYDQIIGLDLDELAVDGCITKAPAAAKSPTAPRWTGGGQSWRRCWPARPIPTRWPSWPAAGCAPRSPPCGRRWRDDSRSPTMACWSRRLAHVGFLDAAIAELDTTLERAAAPFRRC